MPLRFSRRRRQRADTVTPLLRDGYAMLRDMLMLLMLREWRADIDEELLLPALFY